MVGDNRVFCSQGNVWLQTGFRTGGAVQVYSEILVTPGERQDLTGTGLELRNSFYSCHEPNWTGWGGNQMTWGGNQMTFQEGYSNLIWTDDPDPALKPGTRLTVKNQAPPDPPIVWE